MARSTFQTNPIDLEQLLRECDRGIVQLPDFQRSWVWDEDRQKRLLGLIEQAMGKAAYAGNVPEEGTDVEVIEEMTA